MPWSHALQAFDRLIENCFARGASIQQGNTNALSAINAPYEPGSTLKPFTVVAALADAQIGVEEVDGFALFTMETNPEIAVARALGIHVIGDGMDHQQLSPLGYRLLHRIPRLPGAIVDRLVAHFGGFQALLSASLEDLMQVEGVGETRARAVREGLSRLAETSILERYS